VHPPKAYFSMVFTPSGRFTVSRFFKP
jgi:hypothetical protein